MDKVYPPYLADTYQIDVWHNPRDTRYVQTLPIPHDTNSFAWREQNES